MAEVKQCDKCKKIGPDIHTIQVQCYDYDVCNDCRITIVNLFPDRCGKHVDAREYKRRTAVPRMWI